MGSNQYWAGRVFDCVFIIWRELPKAQPKVFFMKKPGIKPATPGLHDIGLSPTPGRLRCRFIVYTVHNFRDCDLNILACDPIK